MSHAEPKKQEFPEMHWPALSEHMRDGGPEAVLGFIEGFEDATKRLELYQLAQGGFADREPETDLDDLADVVEAGIDEALFQAEEARAKGDDKRADQLTDLANIFSYNLSASLADCWPGDERARERRHYELGLEAADLCLEWRKKLKKGPYPFFMAWWARGMHLLSLDRLDDALPALEESLRHAKEHAKQEGKSQTVDAKAPWSVLLAAGYLAIAHAVKGQPRTALDHVLAALETGANARPGDAEDLRFALEQLRVVAERYVD